MDYKKMLLEARKKGLTNESKMWQSIASIGEGLEMLEESHPDMYWGLMREQHCIMFDGHYSEEFAEHDICMMHSTDKNGTLYEGEHWTKADISSATQGMTFSSGVNDCDKWVAFNAMWHDMHKKFDDNQILDIAYLFFFNDEDWRKSGCKIWDYMSEKY